MSKSKNFIPAYKIVANAIKQQIADGEIANGDVLPTFRTMAEIYKVSRNTISQAIDLLVANGYIRKINDKQFQVLSSDNGHTINWEYFFKSVKETKNLIANNIFNNRICDTLLNDFNNIYTEAKNQTSNEIKSFTFNRGHYGDTKTIDTIIKRLSINYNMNVSHENIMIMPSISLAQHIICKLVASVNTKFITARNYPFYTNTAADVKHLGTINIELDEQGYIPNSLVDIVKNNNLTNNIFYFETINWLSGIKTSNERVLELYDYCKHNNVPIIESNMQSELYFGDEKLVTMKSYDEHANVIYISSVCSQIFPLDHIAFIVAPKYFINLASEVLRHISWSNSSILQSITCNLLNNECYDDVMGKLRNNLRKRHSEVDEILQFYLNHEHCTIDKAQASTFKNLKLNKKIMHSKLIKSDVPFISYGDNLAFSACATNIDLIEKIIINVKNNLENSYG